jgi:hypothetical protein
MYSTHLPQQPHVGVLYTVMNGLTVEAAWVAGFAGLEVFDVCVNGVACVSRTPEPATAKARVKRRAELPDRVIHPV